MRRGPGIAAINKSKIAKQKYATKGSELADVEIAHMVKQLDSFKNFLEDFATKHQSDIKKDPEFRRHFQKLCSQIGVDPLSSSKGFWSEILGVGDFYYEVGVQVIEACLATKPKNGGLLSLKDLHKLVLKGRSRTRQDVSEDDIVRAISKLGIFGSGFQILKFKGHQMVQSVPSELSTDHTTVLQLAEGSGYTSVSVIEKELGWDRNRAKHILDYLIQEGMIWVDKQGPNEVLYWVPGFFPDSG